MAARNIDGSRGGRCRAAGASRPLPGSSSSSGLPLDRVGCYVPGGRYPAALVAAHDRHSRARVAGVSEIIAVCPKPDPVVMLAAREAGIDTAAAARRRARHRSAGFRYRDRFRAWTRSSGPGNAYVAAAKALVSSRLRDRLLRRTERDPDRLDDAAGRPGSRPTCWRRPSTIRTPGRSSSRRAGGWRAAVAAEVRRQMPAEGPAANGCRHERRDHRHARRSTRPSRSANAWHPSMSSATVPGRRRGCGAPVRCSSARSARRPQATT